MDRRTRILMALIALTMLVFVLACGGGGDGAGVNDDPVQRGGLLGGMPIAPHELPPSRSAARTLGDERYDQQSPNRRRSQLRGRDVKPLYFIRLGKREWMD